METTRKHPRTLEEAFGPHTSKAVYPMPDPELEKLNRQLDRLMLWLAVVVTTILVWSCMEGY